MSLFTNFTDSDNNRIESIAIGGFDGLHLGHQKLFSHLGSNGAIVAVENNHMDMTPGRVREKFADFPIFYLQLDSVMGLSGKDFLNLLTKNFPALKKIVVGYDFCFGSNRESHARDLKEWFDKEVVIVTEVKEDNISVHSRNIRNYIRLGEISKTNKLLGREYQVEGEVIKGQGLGMRKLFPTINLLVKNYILPQEGVYKTKTEVNGVIYKSVSFIGHRISTDGSFAVETHILDRQEDFDAKTVTIAFVDKIRENRYFDNLEELRAQIEEDIEAAKN